MKKTAIIIGILLVMAVMVACQPQKKDAAAPQPAVQKAEETGQTAVEEKSAADTSVADAESAAEQAEATASKPQATVSQQDLDQLKNDIEGMEFEDLEGLS